MITLKNVSGRMMVVHILGAGFVEDRTAFGHKTIQAVRVEHSKNGKLYLRKKAKRVPHTITFSAGETIEGLPDKLLSSPEIRAAVHTTKKLQLVSHTPDATTAPKDPS